MQIFTKNILVYKIKILTVANFKTPQNISDVWLGKIYS